MAISQKEEARALSADERELVTKSHHPAVQELSDSELADLLKLMRDRRDKAKTQANQRRREMRGKSGPKGAAASRSDEGSQLKVAILAMATRRLNGEAERRRRMAARVSLVESAKSALAMRQAREADDTPVNSRRAHHGMRKAANSRAENLVRPMETGRQRKAASIAQAKRDAR